MGLTGILNDMRKFKVSVIGVSPYMQHRMDDVKLESWVKSRGQRYEKYSITDPEVIADYHSHMDTKGNYIIPSDHFRMAMIEGGKMVRGKVGGATKSMTNVVAGMFIVGSDVVIPKWDTIDKRSAVNRNIKGRVIVVRPKWTTWNATF